MCEVIKIIQASIMVYPLLFTLSEISPTIGIIIIITNEGNDYIKFWFKLLKFYHNSASFN